LAHLGLKNARKSGGKAEWLVEGGTIESSTSKRTKRLSKMFLGRKTWGSRSKRRNFGYALEANADMRKGGGGSPEEGGRVRSRLLVKTRQRKFGPQ